MTVSETGPRVLVAPSPLEGLNGAWPTVFLAGSIEDGRAIDWQTALIERVRGVPVNLLNPRRVDWDMSWRQDIDDDRFRAQVQWELEGLERADMVVFMFAPHTRSPITLLELGLSARAGRAVVCCPPGFWKKGNVDVVCTRYGLEQVEGIQGLEAAIRDCCAR